MLASRVIKTPEELDTLRESGAIADDIMTYTLSQLSIGATWADVEKAVAQYMVSRDVDPLPGSPMLFGGAYDLVFRPDLFRTRVNRPFSGGEVAILETQGRYKNFWIDINRTAHIGPASDAYRDQYNAVRDTFDAISARLKPGVNTADICQFKDIEAAQRLDPPEKLLGGCAFRRAGSPRKPGEISRHRPARCEGGFRRSTWDGDQYRLPILWQRARSIPYGKRLYRERHGGGASLSVHSRPSGGQLAPPPSDILFIATTNWLS